MVNSEHVRRTAIMEEFTKEIYFICILKDRYLIYGGLVRKEKRKQ